MAVPFSIFERGSRLDKLQAEHYDMLIIGGGITGAGIALDAASRGLKTILVEKEDFAFGTSSRSTKLIHGGLRYLKQLEFGLVKEVGSERAVVHNLAPHLVIPEKMLLPLSEKKGLGYWLTSIGLRIYDYLANVKGEDQRRMLTKNQTLRHEPLLRKDDIKGGAIYAEYRTDDARLTIEIIKAAFQHGATVLSYVEAKDFIYAKETIEGVQIVDRITNQMHVIKASVVVSAAGPWVDELREINRSKSGKRLHLTKGVHIVLPREKLPVRQAIYFDVDDGRMIFAIPRGRTTYVGTTDTNYEGSLERVVTTPEDAAYLIKAVNATFPSAQLTVNDIESSWAGLRPLIHEDGKSASELSRKDEIFESPTGLISIAGGKLTGYRKMAERVVNLVIKKHFVSRDLKKCHTDKIKLAGSQFASNREIRRYIAGIYKTIKLHNLGEAASRYLVENYGRQAGEILSIFQNIKENAPAEFLLLKAELQFAMHHEMIVSLSDFVVRRTGLLYFDIHKLSRWKRELAHELRSMLGWDEKRTEQELKKVEDLIRDVTSFK
jgi:glycerol-3-phosphate dehydrogenase